MSDEQTEPDMSTVLAGRWWARQLLQVMVTSAEEDGDRVLVHIAHDAIDALEAAQAALADRMSHAVDQSPSIDSLLNPSRSDEP